MGSADNQLCRYGQGAAASRQTTHATATMGQHPLAITKTPPQRRGATATAAADGRCPPSPCPATPRRIDLLTPDSRSCLTQGAKTRHLFKDRQTHQYTDQARNPQNRQQKALDLTPACHRIARPNNSKLASPKRCPNQHNEDLGLTHWPPDTLAHPAPVPGMNQG